jgi:hypothetical protein
MMVIFSPLEIIITVAPSQEISILRFAEKVLFSLSLSFLRKQESSLFKAFWTPAFAGVTGEQSFFASGKYNGLIDNDTGIHYSWLAELC